MAVLTFCAVLAFKARCTFTAVVIDGVRARATVLTWIRIAVIGIFSKENKKKRFNDVSVLHWLETIFFILIFKASKWLRPEKQSESKMKMSALTFCAVLALKARCTFTAVVVYGVRARATVLTWIRIAVIDIFSKEKEEVIYK